MKTLAEIEAEDPSAFMNPIISDAEYEANRAFCNKKRIEEDSNPKRIQQEPDEEGDEEDEDE
jgi:hypothetical protein